METDWLLICIYVKIKYVISAIVVVRVDIAAKFKFRSETSAIRQYANKCFAKHSEIELLAIMSLFISIFGTEKRAAPTSANGTLVRRSPSENFSTREFGWIFSPNVPNIY